MQILVSEMTRYADWVNINLGLELSGKQYGLKPDIYKRSRADNCRALRASHTPRSKKLLRTEKYPNFSFFPTTASYYRVWPHYFKPRQWKSFLAALIRGFLFSPGKAPAPEFSLPESLWRDGAAMWLRATPLNSSSYLFILFCRLLFGCRDFVPKKPFVAQFRRQWRASAFLADFGN
ncbi:hypothetical protein CDAR_277331 [Caerostris darwini]|uniref:Uncharacterized protein n=1 Tax=Caerostris darwini TaxID=1538125 RepID=A0AAV4VRK7_9ARAC|nr:hypothetical protein CDAR_277331 [Caerostris darwini]